MQINGKFTVYRLSSEHRTLATQKAIPFTYRIFAKIICIFVTQIWILNSWCELTAGAVSLKLVFAKMIKP